MRPADKSYVLSLLDGLLRTVYQQGQRELSWSDLCALCEDAAVAAELADWDRDPHGAYHIVTLLGTQLAAWLLQQSALRRQDGDQHRLLATAWSVPELLQVVADLQAAYDDWSELATA